MTPETIATFVEKATSGMREDIQAVGPGEDPRDAATRIVLLCDEHDSLLDDDSSDEWEDLDPTPDDRRALMDGCIDAIEIAVARGRVT